MKSIFVSSTFRDFHKERDLLRSRIIPAVNNVAKQYGEFVNICDLRWGVDTSKNEDPDSEVLSVCLNEIDRSRPYMIVFLGERYGYVPGKKSISDEVKRRGLNLEDLEISVTHLEIEYGAFHSRETLEHTWFYFREMEYSSGEDGCRDLQEKQYLEKLTSLKQRIKNLAGEQVHFYKIGSDAETSYEELCQAIQKNLVDGFMKDWEKYAKMSPDEKDDHNQWNYLREKAGYFQVGHTFAQCLMEQLEKTAEDKSVFVLTGAMGTGKSTCFSHVCTEMEKKGWDVIPVMCGNTTLSTDENGILYHIVWMMEKLLEVPHMIEETKVSRDSGKDTASGGEKESLGKTAQRSEIRRFQERLSHLCGLYEQTGRRMLLAVDAVDQLYGVKDIRNLLFLPQGNKKNIKMLLTTTDQEHQALEAEYYSIPILCHDEKAAVIDRALYNSGKQLASVVYAALFEKKVSQNPLFLHLAVNNLCLMDEEDYQWIGQFPDFMEGTNKRQIELVNHFPDDLGQMAAETLRKASGIIGSEAIERCIDYISVSRHGLRSVDLEQLLEREGLRFVPLNFSQLLHTMNELYTLRSDGRYDYLHRALRQGILDKLGNVKELHRRIAEHLLSLPVDDTVRQQELYYHLIQADMGEAYIKNTVGAFEYQLPEKKYIMEELFRKCMEDQGVWILGLAERYLVSEEQELLPSSRTELAAIMLMHLYYFETVGKERFLESKTGLMLYHHIMEKLVEILERAEKDRIDQEQWEHVLSIGYSQMGENLEKMDLPETLEKAGEYYDRVIRIREMQAERSQNDFTIMELAIAYQDKGDWLDEMGDSKSRAVALAMYEHALKLMDAVVKVSPEENHVRNYALLWSRIGSMHRKGESLEGLQQALKFYGESEKLLRELTETYDSETNKVNLARTLCQIADVYGELEGNESIRKAIGFYQEAYELVIHAYDEIYSGKCVDQLIDISCRMAFMHTKSDQQQMLLQALETYEKAFQLACEASNVRGLTMNDRDMIRVCHGICSVSIRLAEQKYLEKALKYAHMASEHSRALVLTNQTMKNISSLVKSLCYEGEVYENISTDAALKEAKKLYDESLKWLKKLEESEYDSIRTRGELIKVLEQTGQLYERAGGVLNYKKALPYYETALTLDEKNIEYFGSSPDRQRSVEISCNKVGNMLMQIGEKDALEKARPYLERALNIAVKLAEEIESDKYQWDLSFCYNLYATLLWKMENNIEEVKGYYLKAFEIRKKLNDIQETLASRKTLAGSYEKLVMIYSRSSVYTDLVKAASYANAFSMLCEKIMLEEGTLDSKRSLANAYLVEAEQYARLGGAELKYILPAQKCYGKCLELWEKIIGQIGTYRAYMDYLTAYNQAARLSIRMGEYSRAENYFEKSLALAEEFLKAEPEKEYRLMLSDIYMEISEYYKSRDAEAYREKCLELYRKALEIYEAAQKDSVNPADLSNMASICYSIACSTMVMEQYEEAISYFERSIELTLRIPEEERSQQRIICLYSSYNRVGAMCLEMGRMALGIVYFEKAVKCEEDALDNIRENGAVVEIMEDSVKDVLFLGGLYQSVNRKEEAEKCYDKAIDLLGILFQTCPEEKFYEEELIKTCTKQIQLKLELKKKMKDIFPYLEMSLGLMKKYPEFEDYFQQLEKQFGIRMVPNDSVETDRNEELLDLYERAEYYLTTNKTELGIQTFREFLAMLEKIPKGTYSDQVFIYEYNTYNQLAAYYVNQHTESGYRTAIDYFEITVQKEMEAVDQVSEERIQEILCDICDDCAHAISLCHRMKEYEKENQFYEKSIQTLIILASAELEEYEVLLARQAMECAAFKMKYMPGEEAVGELLYIAYNLSLKHPELADLKQMLENMMKDWRK